MTPRTKPLFIHLSFRCLLAILTIIFLQAICFCSSQPLSEKALKTVYNSLDPRSISQHLAFYELYPDYPLGQQALKEAWLLLTGLSEVEKNNLPSSLALNPPAIEALLGLVNRPPDLKFPSLDNKALQTLNTISKKLHHKTLKGHYVWSEAEVLSLPAPEIDIARGLFLTQFGEDRLRILCYEALIDLMALQIKVRLSPDSSPEEKIIAINTFIFDDLGFRFPPHSLYAKNIDCYTFLPSVLDSRRGVCLGVSMLYLCIAQRLDLSLEMITPPGHIYVRYCRGESIINIETTARGIHVDCDEYLSISTRSLQKRTIKEVIGMTHFNQASVFWQKGEFEKALQAYQKAEPYMKEDPFLKELMGYILILTGEKEEGEKLITQIKEITSEHSTAKNTMAEDYLNGHVDAKGISVLFRKEDEERASLLAKKEALEATLKTYPNFRAGILSLAMTWLKLHRAGEALETLKHYLTLDEKEPEVHYLLSVLSLQRLNYPAAWHHLHEAEIILKEYHYSPKILRELRRELLRYCPE